MLLKPENQRKRGRVIIPKTSASLLQNTEHAGKNRVKGCKIYLWTRRYLRKIPALTALSASAAAKHAATCAALPTIRKRRNIKSRKFISLSSSNIDQERNY